MIGKKQLLIAVFAAAFSLFAQDLVKNPIEITMPDGEVYRHPKVLSKNAEGLTIMHDTGVAFWRFDDLPVSIQKKFHYNPAKSAEYQKEVTQRRIALQDKLAKKRADFAFEQKVVALDLQRYYVNELKFKIGDISRDLGQDQKDLPAAKSEVKGDMNQIAKLAEDQNNGNSYGGVNCGYGNCYSYRQNDSSMAYSAKGNFDQDIKDEKSQIESLEFKRDWDESSLPRLKQEYQHQMQHLAQMESEMVKIKKQHSSEEFLKMKNKALDVDYKKLQTSLEHLKKLCDDKLITPDEYIQKKEKLLAEFK